jgi:hypothetical protein
VKADALVVIRMVNAATAAAASKLFMGHPWW